MNRGSLISLALCLLVVACEKKSGTSAPAGGVTSEYTAQSDYTKITGPKVSVSQPPYEITADISFGFEGSSPAKPIEEIDLTIRTKPTGRPPADEFVDAVLKGITPEPIKTSAFTQVENGERVYLIGMTRAQARQLATAQSVTVEVNGLTIAIPTAGLNGFGVLAKIPNVTP